jgi:hypothetical protein
VEIKHSENRKLILSKIKIPKISCFMIEVGKTGNNLAGQVSQFRRISEILTRQLKQ